MQDVHGDFNPSDPWNKKQLTRKIIKFRKILLKCYIWSTALYGAETWTLPILHQKYLESFEMWCWRRMEKISLADHMRNIVLHIVKEERNILHTIKGRKAN
jgi:squalene cyclase